MGRSYNGLIIDHRLSFFHYYYFGKIQSKPKDTDAKLLCKVTGLLQSRNTKKASGFVSREFPNESTSTTLCRSTTTRVVLYY